MTSVNGTPARRSDRMRDWNVRRFIRPVNESVEACSCVRTIVRNMRMRAAGLRRQGRERFHLRTGRHIAFGTDGVDDAHRAAHEAHGHADRRALPRAGVAKVGQASSAALVGNVTGAPLRTATQENGKPTGQPGPSGFDPATTACSRFDLLLSASSSSTGGRDL